MAPHFHIITKSLFNDASLVRIANIEQCRDARRSEYQHNEFLFSCCFCSTLNLCLFVCMHFSLPIHSYFCIKYMYTDHEYRIEQTSLGLRKRASVGRDRHLARHSLWLTPHRRQARCGFRLYHSVNASGECFAYSLVAWVDFPNNGQLDWSEFQITSLCQLKQWLSWLPNNNPVHFQSVSFHSEHYIRRTTFIGYFMTKVLCFSFRFADWVSTHSYLSYEVTFLYSGLLHFTVSKVCAHSPFTGASCTWFIVGLGSMFFGFSPFCQFSSILLLRWLWR